MDKNEEVVDPFTGSEVNDKEKEESIEDKPEDGEKFNQLKDEILSAMDKASQSQTPGPASDGSANQSMERRGTLTDAQKKKILPILPPKRNTVTLSPSPSGTTSTTSDSSNGNNSTSPQQPRIPPKNDAVLALATSPSSNTSFSSSSPSSESTSQSKQKKSDARANREAKGHLNIKEGFLIKRGSRVKNWKTRWFVLKPDGYYYFNTPKEWTPKSIIPMKEIRSIEDVDDIERENMKVPENIKYFFFFKIISTKREYYCAATSEDERDDWVIFGNQSLEVLEQIRATHESK